MFETLQSPPADALHAVMGAFAADTRADKIDLGVGVYRDESGHSPIMRAVQLAERELAVEEGTKAYLPLRGFPPFLEQMAGLLFPEGAPPELAAIQSVGGTGAISLALELAHLANPELTVHIARPTWPNHFGVCHRLGVPTCAFDYLDHATGEPDLNAFVEQIDIASAGDIVILHGPCHNPTGRDLNPVGVARIVCEAQKKGVRCLIDAAYYGLGNQLDTDLSQLRRLLQISPETMLVLSGSKAFGLYRDRIGVLFLNTETESARDTVLSNLETLARANYSMPAAHGAQVIARILETTELRKAWEAELTEMQKRILSLRSAITEHAQGHNVFSRISSDKGIFSSLPISADVVGRLAKDEAIYMPQSGRINVAGLSHDQVPQFVEAVIRCV